jgi:hypothetical protein
MYEEFAKHKARIEKARTDGKPDPRLPDYIGLCFMELADGIGRRPNFSKYSYLDEMKADGIENCIIAANNFDPDRSEQNPFGYFSKIIWWAFLRRIDKEKKQTYVKYKAMQNLIVEGGIQVGDGEAVSDTVMDHIISDFEGKKTKKEKVAKSKKPRGVEILFSHEDDPEDVEKAILDHETGSQLGYSRTGEGTSTGRKKPNGAKHRG